MISEEVLREATKETDQIITDSLPADEFCSHEFSKNFQNKMKRVARKGNHPALYRYSKHVASFFLILLVGVASFLTFNVEARNKLWNWIITADTYGVTYIFKNRTGVEDIDTDYYLSELPAGYQEKERFDDFVVYSNADGETICFAYETSSDKGVSWVSLEDVQREIITFNDYEADLYTALNPKDDSAIIWIDPDTNILFYISGCLSAEELIDLANSVAPAK